MSFLLEFRNNKMVDKAELKKKYKETPRPMGIYIIKNLVNGKIFISKHKNINGRINRHKFELGHGFEGIAELQEDYKKFGPESFSFEILDQLEPKDDPLYDYSDDLSVLEEMWLEKLQPFGERGYNKAGK
jgi:group I intron endonuclease